MLDLWPIFIDHIISNLRLSKACNTAFKLRYSREGLEIFDGSIEQEEQGWTKGLKKLSDLIAAQDHEDFNQRSFTARIKECLEEYSVQKSWEPIAKYKQKKDGSKGDYDVLGVSRELTLQLKEDYQPWFQKVVATCKSSSVTNPVQPSSSSTTSQIQILRDHLRVLAKSALQHEMEFQNILPECTEPTCYINTIYGLEAQYWLIDRLYYLQDYFRESHHIALDLSKTEYTREANIVQAIASYFEIETQEEIDIVQAVQAKLKKTTVSLVIYGFDEALNTVRAFFLEFWKRLVSQVKSTSHRLFCIIAKSPVSSWNSYVAEKQLTPLERIKPSLVGSWLASESVKDFFMSCDTPMDEISKQLKSDMDHVLKLLQEINCLVVGTVDLDNLKELWSLVK